MALLRTRHGSLYYHVKGEGPPLLLLHGLSRSSRHWLGFDRLLAKHFKVITMDPRGLGRSRAPASWWHTTEHMADDAADLLRHLNVGRAHIFGLSLGGMVALSLGLRYRDLAASLIVVNTSSGGMGYPRLMPQAILAMSLGVVFKPLLHPLLLNACLSKSCPPSLRKKILARWKKIEAREGVPYLTTMKHLIAAVRFRLRDDLPKLAVPTLVVYGSDDTFVSHGNSRAMAELIPLSELCCLEGAGHELTLDHPDELSACIVKFTTLHNGQ